MQVILLISLLVISFIPTLFGIGLLMALLLDMIEDGLKLLNISLTIPVISILILSVSLNKYIIEFILK